ncbi:MAG TPA: DinB family protein [Chitinophagales bacterium]|nr:DinB family protein [Chitinophagales bacterium]
MTNTEANILADVYESVRALTKWYISRMKDVDMHKVFEVDGKKFNSAYWVTAHLIWSEQFLLLQTLGGKSPEIPWLEQFRMGSPVPERHDGLPSVKQILDVWKEIHSAAMKHVRSLSDEILSSDNPSGFGFGGDNSYRMMIHHAIRHEAVHTGHLSWLCKMYGIRTV